MNDFIEYEDLKIPQPVHTATTLEWITGVGTVLITFRDDKDKVYTARLAPVFYMEKLNQRLISQGRFLQEGMVVRGNSQRTNFYDENRIFMSFLPRSRTDTLFFVENLQVNVSTMKMVTHSVDYRIMHRRMGHPSREALGHMRKHVKGFPAIDFPSTDPICRGCAEGKMSLRPFPPTTRRASKAFEIVHSDLKEVPTISYHKYKYAMVFLDDYTSHGWCIHFRALHDYRDPSIHVMDTCQAHYDIPVSVVTDTCSHGCHYGYRCGL